jgi:hypothetical protein
LSISGGIRDDLGRFLPKLEARLSGIVAARERACEKEIEEERRKRVKFYAAAFGTGAIVTLLGVSGYLYLTMEIAQNVFHAIVWNMVAQFLCAPISYLVAKLADRFPRRSASIRFSHQALLRNEVEETVSEEIRTHDFSVINLANLSKQLSAAYYSVVESDPDAWNQIAFDRLKTLRELHANLTTVRAEYISLIESMVDQVSSYFSDATKNLQQLNSVADLIKARAIAPSFNLLDETRKTLERIRNQVHEIEFS